MAEKRIPWWLRRKDEKQDDKRAVISQAVDYTAISSVSVKILRLLQDGLVPKLLQSRDNIGLCSPDQHSDLVLGVHLYDIMESGAARVNGLLPLDRQYMQFPPMYLELYYVITAYLTMDVRYRSEEEHRLLGGVMQLFHDNPVLEPEEGGEELQIELNNIDIEEKMKLWSGFGSAYRLALYYKVAPVRLDSNLYRKVTKVTEIRTDVVEKTGTPPPSDGR